MVKKIQGDLTAENDELQQLTIVKQENWQPLKTEFHKKLSLSGMQYEVLEEIQ